MNTTGSFGRTSDRCYFHDVQIDSFCAYEACCFPMCPQCRSSHLAHHQSCNTLPHIITLKEAFALANQELVDELLPLRKVVAGFQQFQEQRMHHFLKSIESAKQQVLIRVEAVFQKLIENMQVGIYKYYEELKIEMEEQILRLEGYSLGLRAESNRMKQLVRYFSERTQVRQTCSLLSQKRQLRETLVVHPQLIRIEEAIQIEQQIKNDVPYQAESENHTKPFKLLTPLSSLQQLQKAVTTEVTQPLGLTDRICKLKQQNQRILKQMHARQIF